MEPWRVCLRVIADLHHTDEEQDHNPDPDLHQSERSNSESLKMKGRIRIRDKDIKNIKWHCISIPSPRLKLRSLCILSYSTKNCIS